MRQDLATRNNPVLEIASGSAMESEHHIQIAGDLGYLNVEKCEALMQRAVTIQRMLRSLARNLPHQEGL